MSIVGSEATGDGGGFFVSGGLKLSGASVHISASAAGGSGGGFVSLGDLVLEDSVLSVRNSSAGSVAGGFYLADTATMGLQTSNLTASRTFILCAVVVLLESSHLDMLLWAFGSTLNPKHSNPKTLGPKP